MRYTYEQPEYIDLAGARHLVQELKKYIQQIMDGNIDVSSYIKREDLASYATKSYVDTAVTEVATSGEVDLSNYYNKQEVDNLIPEPITEDEIRSLFANEGYATETYVNNAVSNVPATDLSNYYTKDETYSKAEVDTLVDGGSSSGGGTTEPTEPDTPTGKSSITGNTNLKYSYSRTYTGKFFDANDNEVTDVIGTWTITSAFAESEFTTKIITDNSIKLGVDNENLIGESFTLTFSDSNGKYTPSTIEITVIE